MNLKLDNADGLMKEKGRKAIFFLISWINGWMAKQMDRQADGRMESYWKSHIKPFRKRYKLK